VGCHILAYWSNSNLRNDFSFISPDALGPPMDKEVKFRQMALDIDFARGFREMCSVEIEMLSGCCIG